MKELGIFLFAFISGGALIECTAREQQTADRAVHDICRVVVTYDVDGGDPVRDLLRAVDELERLRREREAGAR